MNSKSVYPLPAMLLLVLIDIVGLWYIFQEYSGLMFIKYVVIYSSLVTLGFITQYRFHVNQINNINAYNEQVIRLDTEYPIPDDQ